MRPVLSPSQLHSADSAPFRSLQFDPAPRAGEPLVSRRVPDVRPHLPSPLCWTNPFALPYSTSCRASALRICLAAPTAPFPTTLFTGPPLFQLYIDCVKCKTRIYVSVRLLCSCREERKEKEMLADCSSSSSAVPPLASVLRSRSSFFPLVSEGVTMATPSACTPSRVPPIAAAHNLLLPLPPPPDHIIPTSRSPLSRVATGSSR